MTFYRSGGPGLGILRAGGGQGGSIAVKFGMSIGMVWVLQVGLHMVCDLFLMNWGQPLTSGSMGYTSESDDPGNS